MNRRIAAAAVVLCAALAGCSTGSSKTAATTTAAAPCPTGTVAASTPAEIAALSAADLKKRAQAALCSATGVRIAGVNTDKKASFTIDMRYGQDGSIGTFSSSGFDFQLRQIGAEIYLKAPDQFWKRQLQANQLAIPKVAGKWVKGTDANAYLKDLAGITDLRQFAGRLFAATAKVAKDPQSTVDGTPVFGLTDTTGTLFVGAADARPVRLTGAGDNSGSSLAFTEYGAAPTVDVPPAAETVDASILGK